MKKTAVISVTLLSLMWLISFSSDAQAGDLEWSGLYRIEGLSLSNSELYSSGNTKEYGLHHLVLKPKIVLSDGVNVFGRFDIFNNNGFEGSQFGQFFGGTTPRTVAGSEHDATAGHQAAETLLVNNLYITIVQEFGSLLAGRAPLHFGLGMTYNAGEGLFDHWFDNRDLVGYKFVMGNLYFLPMIAKVSEGANINENDDNTEYMLQVQYENAESDVEMGAFYRAHKASGGGTVYPIEAVAGSVAVDNNDKAMDTTSISFYYLKDTDRFRFGVEGTTQSGKTGLTSASGGDVSIGGFGLASEFEWRPENSKWRFGGHLGYAGGDDFNSDSKIESVAFDRNYDVAMLLFNHPLGSDDFLGTGYLGGGPTVTGANASISSPDTESISNVMYLSPYFKWQWKDKWRVDASLTTGWLNQVDETKDVEKGLGFELDASLTYTPNERMEWVNQLGYFTPGSAFEGGTDDFDTKSIFGFITKAAIRF